MGSRIVNFEDSPSEAAFRAGARAWLTAHVAPRPPGSRQDHVFSTRPPTGGRDVESWVAECRAWQRTKYEGGYGAITWPAEWGGRDGTPMEEIIFLQEERRFDVATGALASTIGHVAPTLRAHGTAEQRAHLAPILRGDEIWCQLFSEPDAGSDLAAIATRARQAGNEWIIDGQKVWTSGAQYAQWGYLLARTDPHVPKHRGLTAFLLPMNSPGISVRPLCQITGTGHFNEVFLDGVVISDANRLGTPGAGWKVALTTLMSERFTTQAIFGAGDRIFAELLDQARACGGDRDPVIRQRLAALHGWLEVHRFTTCRSLTAISRGEPPGPEGSIAKLTIVRILRQMAELAVQLEGPAGTLAGRWSDFLLEVPGISIAGGTDEVQRNVIAERVLGLPEEPRLDKTVPFAALREVAAS